MKDIGYVYFFHNKTSGFVKIGFSKHNPIRRLSAIRNANPDDIQFAGAIKGTMDDEKALHRKFKKMRIEREWFKSDVLDFLKTAETVDISKLSRYAETLKEFPKDPVFFSKNLLYLFGDTPFEDIAIEYQIPEAVIYSWAKDGVHPSSKNFHLISRISKKFNVDINDLFFTDLTANKNDPTMSHLFGSNLELLLKQRNLSAARIGKEIGVSPKTVLEWIGQEGRIPRSLDHIKRLANYFEISTHKLLFGEEDVNELITNQSNSTALGKLMDHIGELSDEYEIVIRKKSKDVSKV